MRRTSCCIRKLRPAISAPASADVSRGFPRLELALVIVALVIIFLLLLLSILNLSPHPGPRRLTWVNNLRQLTIGWLMYAADYKDQLVGNAPYVSLATVP